ncbi:MAG: UvrD-helicase domain-containing protein, partial [Comamonas sp.]
MSHVLNAHDFPLWGSRLIEASAGTGKTWTIAALYLRLVLGHGGENAHPRALVPAEILVMTFTRAATRELSDRIRARLTEAVQCFRGEAQPAAHDTLLQALLADYPEGGARTAAAWRLAMAAEAMDDAAV